MPDKLTKIQQKEVKKEVKKRVEKKVEQEIKKVEKKLAKRLIKRTTHKTLKSARYIGSEFKAHATTAIIAAFSFLIALQWRDFITLAVEVFAKTQAINNPLMASLYTAIIVTILAILGITLASRWAKKPEESK